MNIQIMSGPRLTGARILCLRSSKLCISGALILLGSVAAQAIDVKLKVDDASSTSSFGGSTNWDNNAVPSAGNAYFTGAHTLRSINNATPGSSNYFKGDRLTIDAGGGFLGKVVETRTNNAWAINVANYFFNGGYIQQANKNSDWCAMLVGGTVTVTAPTMLGALGATTNGGSFETLEIVAPISGSEPLQVAGTNLNSATDTGLVKLSAANPYSGTITVTNANSSGVIASTLNRLLQLNNVDALSNATLRLVNTTANPVSFTAASINLGGLSGTSSQALSDTNGGAVILVVGAINSTSTYSGPLTGNGSLTKVGTGTLTLSGANTFSGITTISNGTLALSGQGSLGSSIRIASSGVQLDVSGLTGSTVNVAAGKTLSGVGLVNGSVSMSVTSTLAPGDGPGTLTVLGDLALNVVSTNLFELSDSVTGVNDQMRVGGTLKCNNSTISIVATDGMLDATSDYVLLFATNDIIGSFGLKPVFVGAAPVNAAFYSVEKSGNTVVLHYNVEAVKNPPNITSFSVSPASLVRNQSTLLRVTALNGDGAVTGVTADASAIGASSSVILVLDNTTPNVWTNTVTVSAGVGVGTQTLLVTATDDNGLSSYSIASLTVTAAVGSQVWNGTGCDNKWSSNPNWTSGFAPGFGDSVTFAASGNTSPNMDYNNSVTGVTFSSDAPSFTIGTTASTLSLTGSGITNNSVNPQIVNLPMTFGASQTLNPWAGGNMTFSSNISMGSFSLTMISTNGATVAITGDISGTGSVTKNYTNSTLVLAGNNSYTGGTSVGDGILVAKNGNSFGTAGTVSCVKYSAGIVLDGGEAGINFPSAVSFKLSNDGYTAGNKTGAAVRNISGHNTINGVINGTAGGGGIGLLVDSGSLTLAGNLSIASGTGNGARGAMLMGDSTEASTISGAMLDLDANHPFLVKKFGKATWILSGPNTYSAGTIISNGTLVVNSSTGTGTNFVTGSTAVLAGSGTISGATTIASGGALTPRPAGGSATVLTINNNLTLNSASANFTLSSSANGSNDEVAGVSQLTADSSVTFNITNASGILDQAADYTLISSATLNSGAGGTPALVVNGVVADQVSPGTYQLLVTDSGVALHYIAPAGSPDSSFTGIVPQSNGNMTLTFSGSNGLTYRVLSATSLVDPAWTEVATIKVDASGIASFVDTDHTSTMKFYRVVCP